VEKSSKEQYQWRLIEGVPITAHTAIVLTQETFLRRLVLATSCGASVLRPLREIYSTTKSFMSLTL